MRRKQHKVKIIDGLRLEPTSSLNDYYMCVCTRKFINKSTLRRHINNCVGIRPLVCRWCNVQFTNQGNLKNHAVFMHGETSSNNNISKNGKPKARHKCEACDVSYTQRTKIKHHIRRLHFNLWAKVPLAESKLVNQIWYEKVQNTDLIVQITKTGLNTLVMKPLPPDVGVEVHESNEKIDLRSRYPTGRPKTDAACKICFKIYRKIDLPKHMNETHFKLEKHKCNYCQKSFKRSYLFLKHVCYSKGRGNRVKRKVNGVTQKKNSLMRIASVASLKPVVID